MHNTTIEKKVLEFYSELTENLNHRFESWEHCYIKFKKTLNKSSLIHEDKDILSLHLAFYLASWGMYRGSSFILQKDYKVFYPVIDLLFDNKDHFHEHKIDHLLASENDDLIKSYINDYFIFDNELSKILNTIRLDVKQNVVSKVSYTLKTKIILGTYGTIPAYDRFFQDGVRDSKELDLIISYSKNGVFKILKYAQNNLATINNIKIEIDKIQKKNNSLNKIQYPVMKIVDMYFWKIGFDIDQK